MTGIELIAAERQRQIEVEGWAIEHDDLQDCGEMTQAARKYLEVAMTALLREDAATYHRWASEWPWHKDLYKPSNDPIRNLEKAGALIAAEIDRLQRLAK